jgi:DNA-binding NtrC family response regulator
MVSRSEVMRRVLGILPAVARSDAAVLIRGPSGSGKELVARAIHRLSQRNADAFVKLSGAAISDDLGDDEPYGRRGEGGSRLPSWVGEVAAGTLFLDEIGDLQPFAQTRLFHILDQEAFQPVRGNQNPSTHTRVIASTRYDLATEP